MRTPCGSTKNTLGATRLTLLTILIMKKRILGIFALCCFRWCALCACFLREANPSQTAEKRAIWGVLRRGLKPQIRPDRTLLSNAPAVLRLCSSKRHMRGAWPKALAPKTLFASRLTLTTGCSVRVCDDFWRQPKMVFSRCTIGFVSAPNPGLLSVLLCSNSSSYLKSVDSTD